MTGSVSAGVARLGLNEVPWRPSSALLDSACHALGVAHRYPSWDAERLRNAIGGRLGVPSDSVVISNGSIGVIQQALVAAGPGEVAYCWPSFDAFPPLVAGLGMTSARAGVQPEGACDLDDLAAKVGPATSAIIVCSPNTPTGGLVTRDRFERFLADVPPTVLTILDEAYGEFVDDAESLHALDLLARYPNLVITRTFSKAYGIAGLRVGYAVASRDTARRIALAGVPFAISAPAEAAAIAALADIARLERAVSTIKVERGRLADGLRGLGAEVVEGHGNFVWVPLGADTERASSLLTSADVLVKVYPGAGVRITVGNPDDTDRVLAAWSPPAPSRPSGHDHWVVSTGSLPVEISPQGHLTTPGVNDRTAGTTQLAANLVTMPPGAVATGHVHHDHETIVYLLAGRAVTFMGPRLDPVVQGPGQLLFIPAGVEHLPANLSTQEPAVALVCRSDPKFYESLELLPHIDTTVAELLPGLRRQHDAT
jgi:histidinol-phosphate aminotransferase